MAKKQFLFTNENLYDQNIFGGVYPDFRDALKSDKLNELYSAVEQYYYLTQHFYTKDSEKTEEMLLKAHDLVISTPKHNKGREVAVYAKKKAIAKLMLRALWKRISDNLEKASYFKKSYSTNGDSYAVSRQ